MTGFLASVATVDEMAIVRTGGADVVDLKNPAEGALGAWSRPDLERAVTLWRSWGEGRPALSATIGDQPMEPATVLAAAGRVASTGVPMVKLGVFPGDPAGCFAALGPLAKETRLIAVFFADQAPDVALLDLVAASGFHGAMLDTAEKAGGGLRRHMGPAALTRFVGRAKALGLLAGLAGSLKLDDVAPLAALEPDYLGFRGALCNGGRTGTLSPEAVASVRAALDGRRAAA